MLNWERYKSLEENRLKCEIERLLENEKYYKEQQMEVLVQVSRKQGELNFIDSKIKEKYRKLNEEIEKIKKLEKVESVTVGEECVSIKTKPLYINEPIEDKRYYLGDMIIKINISGNRTGTNAITMFNVNNKRIGYDHNLCNHPHVFNDGDSCFGSLTNTVIKLYEDYELHALTIALLGFLQTCNIGDEAGKQVTNWDEVDDEGNIIQTGFFTEDTLYCENCDAEVDADDVMYCEDCGRQICPECATEIDGRDYCEDCAKNYVQCDECGGWFDVRNSHMEETNDGIFCEDCLETKYTRCEECGELIELGEEVEFEGKHYCADCYADLEIRCEKCGDLLLPDEIIEFNGKYYCSDCYEELEEETNEF